MNVNALSISLLCGIMTLSFVLGIKTFKRKNIVASKFSPYYDYKEEEKYKKYEEIISKSNVPMKTALVIITLGGITIGIITYIVVGVWWIAILSTLAGFLLPKWWYLAHVKSNKKTMLKQMEQASEVIAAVIKTGSSLPEAFERAAQEIKEPLKAELIKTATQIRIGVPSSDAFLEFAQKVDIAEMSVVSIAIDLQEKGMAINIPNLFVQLQSDIRHKIQYKRSIETITSELKMAGVIVAIVPFAVIAIMRISSPEFIAPLFNTLTGLFVFVISVFLIFIGVRWMFNIADLDKD